jgi:hypothetical protein
MHQFKKMVVFGGENEEKGERGKASQEDRGGGQGHGHEGYGLQKFEPLAQQDIKRVEGRDADRRRDQKQTREFKG